MLRKIIGYIILAFIALMIAASVKAQTSILEIKIRTDRLYTVYLPTDRNSSQVLNTKDGIECIMLNQHKQFFRLLCNKGKRRLVYFEEKSPELKSIIMTSEILIIINGIKEI